LTIAHIRLPHVVSLNRLWPADPDEKIMPHKPIQGVWVDVQICTMPFLLCDKHDANTCFAYIYVCICITIRYKHTYRAVWYCHDPWSTPPEELLLVVLFLQKKIVLPTHSHQEKSLLPQKAHGQFSFFLVAQSTDSECTSRNISSVGWEEGKPSNLPNHTGLGTGLWHFEAHKNQMVCFIQIGHSFLVQGTHLFLRVEYVAPCCLEWHKIRQWMV